MAEYISRQAAIEAVWQILNDMGISQKHNERLVEEVEAVFDEIPAISKGEVGDIPRISCATCLYNEANFTPDENDITDYTDITCSYFMTDGMDKDDFCSRWRRRPVIFPPPPGSVIFGANCRRKQKAAEIIKEVTTPDIQVKIPAETVESNIYDQEEIYTNCTVQIWRNSVTGEESIGWWQNEEESG